MFLFRMIFNLLIFLVVLFGAIWIQEVEPEFLLALGLSIIISKLFSINIWNKKN